MFYDLWPVLSFNPSLAFVSQIPLTVVLHSKGRPEVHVLFIVSTSCKSGVVGGRTCGGSGRKACKEAFKEKTEERPCSALAPYL